MRYVYYTPYYGLAHLVLVKRGWHEHNCLFVDGEILIKMVSP